MLELLELETVKLEMLELETVKLEMLELRLFEGWFKLFDSLFKVRFKLLKSNDSIFVKARFSDFILKFL